MREIKTGGKTRTSESGQRKEERETNTLHYIYVSGCLPVLSSKLPIV